MIYTIENDSLFVEINSLGSELWSVRDKHSDTALLWQGDADIWPRRAPNLFPVCGQLRGGAATINGRHCNLPLHGFARDYEHKVVRSTQDELTLLFTDTDETFSVYPFHFALYTSYRVEGNTLSCTFQVVNKSDCDLYFSAGFHAGFFANDSTVLRFGGPETANRYQMDENSLICGISKEFLKDTAEIKLVGADFPATYLLSGMQSDFIDIVTESRPTVRIGFVGFPYLAIWVKQLPVHFVCVEPWHGLPDWNNTNGEFTTKDGIEMLPPQQDFFCTQTITVLS